MSRTEGGARIMIQDPTPDLQTLMTADSCLPIYRHPPQLDLCPRCLVKLIEHLHLPADTFTPLPPAAEPTPAGALTAKDLIGLGLAPLQR
jgi:hypothetical protein